MLESQLPQRSQWRGMTHRLTRTKQVITLVLVDIIRERFSEAMGASHPGNPNVQEGTAIVVNDNHPSMKDFPKTWKNAIFYPRKQTKPSTCIG